MIIPPNLPAPGPACPPTKARPQTDSSAATGLESRDTLSDARDPLIEVQSTLQHLSNHTSDIGNHLTGPNVDSPALKPDSSVVASPLPDEAAAAAITRSATQTILTQPVNALLAQANVSPSRAQRILS